MTVLVETLQHHQFKRDNDVNITIKIKIHTKNAILIENIHIMLLVRLYLLFLVKVKKKFIIIFILLINDFNILTYKEGYNIVNCLSFFVNIILKKFY